MSSYIIFQMFENPRMAVFTLEKDQGAKATTTTRATGAAKLKSELKGKLFEILEKEDDYIRICDIRVQFSKS